MALRYLARRALEQRAKLVSRVPPPAGSSRPVSTHGSSISSSVINGSKAAAASKGSKESELLGTDASKLTNEQILQKVAKVTSMHKATVEGLMEAARYKAIERWCLMGSAATGAGLAFLHIAYDMHKNGAITFGAEA